MHRLKDKILSFKNIFLKFIAMLVVVFSTSVSYANHYLASNDAWRFYIAPYIWGINMNGSVQVGNNRAHINQTFSDLLHHLNAGGMVWLGAYRGNVGIFGDIVFADLSDTVHDGIYTIKAKSDYGIYSGGLSYKLYERSIFSFEPYIGFRYTSNETTVTLNTPSVGLKATDNQYWTDPIIGAKLKFAFTQAWSAILLGDIGGTKVTSHYSYNVVGLIGYHPQTILTSTTAYLGYRLLDQHYQTGTGASYYNWNMKLFGPLLGLSIAF
ncbi:MAG: hypothetical protein A3F11_04990 [Gammaproteobacteria bacterium RIFCSPHIGHO2_12_FULL_37_14]|nr:MAG: hypothetical protein A3F11_04990 [Gammaproteobacteria bacterium RIFCSPHIGHO2_12_FULL_37_14]